MEITVNGERRRVRDGLDILELLETSKLNPGEFVVEVDQEIVERERFGETHLEPGARVEIVRLVGGG